MYDNVPDLKENEVYVCHVGDGEYSFNVFGAVYNDLIKMLRAMSREFNCKATDLETQTITNEYGTLINFFLDGYQVASVTIEELNPEEYPGGF